MSKVEYTQGEPQSRLAQSVSDAIHDSVTSGLEFDEACCIAIAVVADYARITYGNRYLKDLSKIVRDQAQRPMPQMVGPH